MPVPNTIADLNQAAASNYPLGTDTVGPNLDDYLRAISAFVRQLFDSSPWLLGSVAGTDTVTATCPVPFTAYVNGQTFRFIPAGTNTTSTVTLNINGIGAKSVTKNGATALAPGDLVAGVLYEVGYDGTQMQLKTMPQTAVATGEYCVRGLVGANNATTPNSKMDFSADAVTLKSANGTPSITRFGTGSITNDTGLAGPAANGRDQAGAFSASTWIHFYYIWNGTTLATLSSTVAPATGPTMPTGYTHWAYVGAAFLNGSSQFFQMKFRGANAAYNAAQTALAGGTATVETAVALSTMIPPNAGMVRLRIQYTDPTGAAVSHVARIRHTSTFDYFWFELFSNASARDTSELTMPNVGQNMYYVLPVNTTSMDIYVIGYSMPNGGEG